MNYRSAPELEFYTLEISGMLANYWWSRLHCGPPDQVFGWAWLAWPTQKHRTGTPLCHRRRIRDFITMRLACPMQKVIISKSMREWFCRFVFFSFWLVIDQSRPLVCQPTLAHTRLPQETCHTWIDVALYVSK